MFNRKLGPKAIVAVLIVATLALVPFTAMAQDSGQGDMQNQLPYPVGTDTNRLEIDGDEYDNSGSDVVTLYFTFKDNNSEADVQESGELIFYYEGSAENDGYETGDIKVAGFDVSKTQVASKVWIDDNGGATNGSNDDGTLIDGYYEIEDENDDDDNFEYTIPGSWPTNDYYSAQINFTDEGADQSSYLVANFKVSTAIQYSLCYANGVWGATYWGEWDALPTDSQAPSNLDASTVSWLVVNNTGANPTQQFTVDFTPENFTGQSHSRWINIDYNINWTFYECSEDPGGAYDPDDVDWEEGNMTADDDADGSYTFTFSGTGNHLWVIFMLNQVTEDDGEDEKPVAGHNYDNVLRDDDYRAVVTVTGV